MEGLLVWLASNLSWEALKSALPKGKHGELAIFRQALADAQNRNRELEADRLLLAKIVRQRNMAIEELTRVKRELVETKADLAKARREISGQKKRK
jgi:hypothetical protein